MEAQMPRSNAPCRKDANHAAIVRELKPYHEYGVEFDDVHKQPNFCDLVVGYKPWKTFKLCEVKDPYKKPSERKLTKGEAKCKAKYPGRYVVVYSHWDILREIEYRGPMLPVVQEDGRHMQRYSINKELADGSYRSYKDKFGGKWYLCVDVDARIAELEAENEDLRSDLEHYLDRAKMLEQHWRVFAEVADGLKADGICDVCPALKMNCNDGQTCESRLVKLLNIETCV
jgi:hypothetical protein